MQLFKNRTPSIDYNLLFTSSAPVVEEFIFKIDTSLGDGLSEFKLADGTKVTVQQFYSASIPKDKVDEAMQWLRDNGHGDLIKNTVSVAFGKGEDTLATDLKKYLGANGNSYEDKTGVHPQTLRAFAREQIEAGQNLPLDTLGIYIGLKTVIKEG